MQDTNRDSGMDWRDTLATASGNKVLRSEDLPTPDWPMRMLVRPFSFCRMSSTPSPASTDKPGPRAQANKHTGTGKLDRMESACKRRQAETAAGSIASCTLHSERQRQRRARKSAARTGGRGQDRRKSTRESRSLQDGEAQIGIDGKGVRKQRARFDSPTQRPSKDALVLNHLLLTCLFLLLRVGRRRRLLCLRVGLEKVGLVEDDDGLDAALQARNYVRIQYDQLRCWLWRKDKHCLRVYRGV
jgi:hypothetical protein